MIRRTINGTTYEAAVEVWNTRNAWGHNGLLFINGEIASKSHIRYYNRTWEGYHGQTAMRAAVHNEITARERDLVECYKHRTGLRRLTARRKAEAIANDSTLNELREFLSAI